jgi:hypothetical protein
MARGKWTDSAKELLLIHRVKGLFFPRFKGALTKMEKGRTEPVGPR